MTLTGRIKDSLPLDLFLDQLERNTAQGILKENEVILNGVFRTN